MHIFTSFDEFGLINSLILNEWAVFCMNGQFPLGKINPWHYFLTLAAVLVVLFTLLDDSSNRSIVSIFIQWFAQIFSGLAIFVATHLLLSKPFSKLPPAIHLLVAAFFATTLFTPLALGFDIYWQQESTFDLTTLWHEWKNMTPIAMFSWLIINLPWVLGVRIEMRGSIEEGRPEEQITNENNEHSPADLPIQTSVSSELKHFIELAKINSLQDLIYLKAELHYLRVVTTTQDHLILFNLKDAVQILSENNPQYATGVTHRSFWINPLRPATLKKQGREGILLTANNHKVLVSRSNMKKAIEIYGG